MSWEVLIMKSRISFFDRTVLKKDITRFAPLWALYFVGGVMVMLPLAVDNIPHSLANSLGSCIGWFSMINIVYAALNAQLLFGDLFNSRMCNALHAMPLRRETWFFTHVLAGLLFSLVPNTLGIMMTLPFLGEFWYTAFLWLLGMTLHYLFFFGLAVFSCMCTGSRFAMVAVYGILNFIAPLAGWFSMAVYEPMLYGVQIEMESFMRFCPVAQIITGEYLLFRWDESRVTSQYAVRVFEGLGDGWVYLWITTALGVVLLGGGLLLYRRRALESAGDFMAVRALRPVFAVLYTLCMGVVFTFLAEMTGQGYLLFLLIGLAVGWFTAQMLLNRTIRVFRKGNLLRFGILVAVMALSLAAAKWDVFGITRWSPAAGAVSSLQVMDRKVQNREDLEKLIAVQKELAVNRKHEDDSYGRTLRFEYRMKDGRLVTRSYRVYAYDPVWTELEQVLSKPEYVLGYTNVDSILASLEDVHIEGEFLETGLQRQLLEAMLADCEAGNMAQNMPGSNIKFSVELRLKLKDERGLNYVAYRYIQVNTGAVNTCKWVAEWEENRGKG